MKHIKDFKLFETGENFQFDLEEIEKLKELGFVQLDGEFIYTNNKNLTMLIRKDSESSGEDIDEWFILTIKYEKYSKDMVNDINYFRKFKSSTIKTKELKYDSFEELLYDVRKYKKF